MFILLCHTFRYYWFQRNLKGCIHLNQVRDDLALLINAYILRKVQYCFSSSSVCKTLHFILTLRQTLWESISMTMYKCLILWLRNFHCHISNVNVHCSTRADIQLDREGVYPGMRWPCVRTPPSHGSIYDVRIY